MITKTDEEPKRRIVVTNLGEADALLQDRDHFRSLAGRLLQRGIVSFEDDGWGGWLGKYHETLRETLLDWNSVTSPSPADVTRKGRTASRQPCGLASLGLDPARLPALHSIQEGEVT